MAWTSLKPELNPLDLIQFADFHRVGLEAGDYRIDVAQQARINGNLHWYSVENQNFSVQGERFNLNPQTLHAVFPPKNSRGEFWNVLPHVVLDRSTLPYERTSLRDGGQPAIDPPWLALLVFHDDEAPAPTPQGKNPSPTTNILSTVSLKDLVNPSATTPIWPGLPAGGSALPGSPTESDYQERLEYGQLPTDKAQVIDVQAGLLQVLLPKSPVFDYQNHVRRRLAYLDPNSKDKTVLTAISNLNSWATLSASALPNGIDSHAMADGSTLYRDHNNKVEYVIKGGKYYRVAAETAGLLANRLPMPGERNVVHLVSLEGMYDFSKTLTGQSISVNKGDTTITVETSTLTHLDPTPCLIQITIGSDTQVVQADSSTNSNLTLNTNSKINTSGTISVIAYNPRPPWENATTLDSPKSSGKTILIPHTTSATTLTFGTTVLKGLKTPSPLIITVVGNSPKTVYALSATASTITLDSSTPLVIDTAGAITSIQYNLQQHRLVSLHHWEFFCQDPHKNLEGILQALNGTKTIPVSGGKLTPSNLVEQSSSSSFSLTITQTPYLQIKSEDKVIGGISPAQGSDWSSATTIANGKIKTSSDVDTNATGTINDYLSGESIKVTSGVIDTSAVSPWFQSTALTVTPSTNTIKDSGGNLVGRILSGLWTNAATVSSGVIKNSSETALTTIDGAILDVRAESGSRLGLPIPASASGQPAADYLRAGYVPLKHQFRQGDKSVSWYHGPCLPHENSELNITTASANSPPAHVAAPEITLPAHTADSLLVFDKTNGIFDTSWAAAWELGRMLMLQNTRIATQLYQWKRNNEHSLNTVRYLADYGYQLPSTPSKTGINAGLPAAVAQWFDDLTLLAQVPFNYLAPNPDMLPTESLRFFTVDRLWLECLRDGAFSIGRVLSADAGRDREPLSQLPNIPVLSGVLIRSEAVTGWGKSLSMTGYSKAVPDSGDVRNDSDPTGYPAVKLLRLEQLSPSVMIAIFEGDIQMVDIHVKAEMLHFGFDISAGLAIDFDPAAATATNKLDKTLRNGSGALLDSETTISSAINSSSRTVNWTILSGLMQTALSSTDGINATSPLSPAVFALEMTAGVTAVRFIRSS